MCSSLHQHGRGLCSIPFCVLPLLCLCCNCFNKVTIGSRSESTISLAAFPFCASMRFCKKKQTRGHWCWVLHLLFDRSHCPADTNQKIFCQTESFQHLLSCASVSCALPRFHTANFAQRSSLLTISSVRLFLHVFHLRRGSPAPGLRFAFSVHVLFPFIWFPVCTALACYTLSHNIALTVEQTSRSRRGVPILLCIDFRFLHTSKSQLAKNSTQHTCHEPSFKLSA